MTHKLWGWVFFLRIMALMFYMIFTIATYPMDWIDAGFTQLGDWVTRTLPEGQLRNLIVNGIIAGVGGVVIFYRRY